MFHKVHHNDTCLNISTAFRIHFLELFIINILKALGFKGISDVNKHLPPDAHVTPRILAFYVCQCKVLESSK